MKPVIQSHLSEDKASESLRLSPWSKLGLSESVCTSVKRIGFKKPTPIQLKLIPSILRGEGDIIAMARTGSGKTAAFMLPLVNRLESHCQIVGARAVILCPSRELALQSAEVCRAVCRRICDLRLCLIVGGLSMTKQFDHMAGNPDIIIATPGRLNHALKETKYELRRVQMLVMDEADQLFEMNYEQDLTSIFNDLKLIAKQCILTSATLPTRLVDFSRLHLVNPTFLQVDGSYELSDQLNLDLFYCRKPEKLAALLFWLTLVKEPSAQVIIFCATVHHVNFLSELLGSLGIETCALAGKLHQLQRDDALQRFRREDVKILISTDVASRGIDIPKLSYVFHYDFPASARLFVHRSGRTARVNQAGTAVCLLTKADLPLVHEVMVFIGRKIAQNSVDNAVPLGGFPGLEDQQELINTLMKRNPSLVRLLQSMEGGQRCYTQWVSKEYSPASLKGAEQTMKSYGGPQYLAQTVHPKLEAAAYLKSAPSISDHGLERIFITGMPATPFKASEHPLDKAAVDRFRPASSDRASRGAGVPRKLMRSMAESIEMRNVTERLARQSTGVAVSCDPTGKDTPLDLNDDSMRAEKFPEKERREMRKSKRMKLKKPCSDGPEVFILGSTQSQHPEASNNVSMSVFGSLAQETVDLTPYAKQREQNMQKVRKWDPKTKKYKVVEIDHQGHRVKSNNSSVKKVISQYDKWRKRSELRVQRVGELEDTTLNARRRQKHEPEESIPLPLEQVTRDLGLLEKVKTGHRLNAKETRKYKRVQKLAANPVTVGKEGKQILSLQDLKSKRRELTKKASRVSPTLRLRKAKTDKARHMKKRRQQAWAKGRPTRSAIIIRRK